MAIIALPKKNTLGCLFRQTTAVVNKAGKRAGNRNVTKISSDLQGQRISMLGLSVVPILNGGPELIQMQLALGLCMDLCLRTCKHEAYMAHSR